MTAQGSGACRDGGRMLRRRSIPLFRWVVAGVPSLMACGAAAQAPNGPLLSAGYALFDANWDPTYPAVGDEVRGPGAAVGYFVGGAADRKVGVRGELHVTMHRPRYHFRNGVENGVLTGTLLTLDLPVLLVVPMGRHMRALGGPGLQVRAIGTAHVQGTFNGSDEEVDFSSGFNKDMRPFGIGLSFGMEYRFKSAIAVGARVDRTLTGLMKKSVGRQSRITMPSIMIAWDVSSLSGKKGGTDLRPRSSGVGG